MAQASSLSTDARFCAKLAGRASAMVSCFGAFSLREPVANWLENAFGYRLPRPPQRHLDDFRRHADAHRHDAAAKTAGNDDVAFQPHEAVGEADAVLRRHRGRPAEHTHLATM